MKRKDFGLGSFSLRKKQDIIQFLVLFFFFFLLFYSYIIEDKRIFSCLSTKERISLVTPLWGEKKIEKRLDILNLKNK